ncbi:MAG: YjbH domain-containing protein [Roseovarius sp.]|nr:YjbH domain-containing protein [Roseovarius sp.]
MIRRLSRLTAVAILVAPSGAMADNLTTARTNNYGTPGKLVDMPTAEMAPDGQFSTTVTHFEGFTKSTLTFQILPWMSGSFRYSATDDLTPNFSTFYDRSFDLRFRLFKEGPYRPAVALGLQDFIGTGVLGGEYIVASKSVGDRLTVTGGLGWGRLGSFNSLGSTGTRDTFQPGDTGGDLRTESWFRGDLAAFAGLSYDVTDKLTFSAEYSSDGYDQEEAAGIFDHESPWNFGLDYKINESFALSAFSLHGSEFGARLTLSFNPKDAPAPGGLEEAPLPVRARPESAAADLDWALNDTRKARVGESVERTLASSDLEVEGLRLEAHTAHVRLRNPKYDATAQALGRTLRGLTRTLPDSVETLRVTLVSNGIPTSTVTFDRGDLERLENRAAADALAAAEFDDALTFADLPAPLPGKYPRVSWSVGPYLRTSFFDPDNPLRGEAGLRFKGEYMVAPGLLASGSVSVKAFGNLDDLTRTSNSSIPRVRSEVANYLATEEPVIDNLTLAKYARLGRNVYGRVTAGYLETMYAGVSGEVLWKPVDSRFALGVEANYVEPRDFDQLFGLRSRDTPGGTIPQFNGHVSAYYDLGRGFHTQLDAGRYLAGDWGATLSLDREFANGWEVGAFVTRTDVSSEDFGEGSFDKGIRLTIPLSWFLGKPTKDSLTTSIRPLTRDGGQRVFVKDRLYDVVRGQHQPEIAKSWGKFWR